MNDCSSVRVRLIDFRAGALAGEEKEIIRLHLRQCSSCRDSLELLAREQHALAADLACAVPSRLAERLAQAAYRRPRFRAAQVAAAALIGMLGTFGAYRFLPHVHPPLQARSFWEDHLQVARLPQFRHPDRSPFLVQAPAVAAVFAGWEDEPPAAGATDMPNPDSLPAGIEAPPALPRGYILVGGRASSRGPWTQLLYTDGLRLLSLFQGTIPGVGARSIDREISGDMGTFHLRAWKGRDRDFLLLGTQQVPQLAEIAAGVEDGKEEP